MRNLTVFSGIATTSVLIASLVATPAFAWHPQGVITKSVQNQTTSSALRDANTAADAVAAKPGDILKYVVVVKNAGAADSRGYNDMAKTVMTDTLPIGVELVSTPAQRTISVDMGLIKPGKSVTKEFTVKVIATSVSVIKNNACFTGNSTANDNPQSGCDTANVTVTVPAVPTPSTPPATPVTPAPPTVLPATGIESMIFPALIVGLITYLGVTLKRQNAAR